MFSSFISYKFDVTDDIKKKENTELWILGDESLRLGSHLKAYQEISFF